mgnify:FL=1
MSLKEQLLQDMKDAMKAKEAGKTALSVIRMVRSAIRNTEIDGKCELDDAGVGAVIAKEMKQRKESLADFEKAGRADLVEQVKAEMVVLEKYMPKQLSEDEIRKIVTDIVAGNDGMKMGDVMKAVMSHVKGKADGKVVSAIVKEILQHN